MGAGPLNFPDETGIRIGGESGINSIKIEVHYKDKFSGADHYTGIRISTTKNRPKFLAGVFLIGAASINLPPQGTVLNPTLVLNSLSSSDVLIEY